MSKPFSIKQVFLEVLGRNLSDDVVIDGLNFCNRKTAKSSILSFAAHISYVDEIRNNKAIAALVVHTNDLLKYKEMLTDRDIIIIPDNIPEWVFYDVHEHLVKNSNFYDSYDFPKRIGANCRIHPTAIIEDGVIIEDYVTIGAYSFIGRGSTISSGTVIENNTSIASNGFQIIKKGSQIRHITHCGGVFIGKNAYIRNNTCIDQALFEGYTFIGANAHIDNLVHVGHNGYVGDGSVVVAGVSLCGSCIIEDGAWIGPNSSVLNNITIGKGAKIGMGSVVTRDVEQGKLAYGVPAKTK